MKYKFLIGLVAFVGMTSVSMATQHEPCTNEKVLFVYECPADFEAMEIVSLDYSGACDVFPVEVVDLSILVLDFTIRYVADVDSLNRLHVPLLGRPPN